MRNKYFRWFTTFLSLAACVWLFKIAYTGLDFREVMQHLRQLNLMWVGILVLISLSCHTFRSLRWQMLLAACGQRVAFWKVFLALMSGYFVNQALVRGGELIRCYLIKRSDRVGFGTSLGSVVSERLIDTFCLAVLMLTFFVVLEDISYAFFQAHIQEPLMGMLNALPLLKIAGLLTGLALLLVFLIWRFRHRFRNYSRQKGMRARVYGFVQESLQGLFAVRKVESKTLFAFYTLLIWTCYFLMTYLWFFTLPDTQHLGLKAALFIWVIGNIGRLVPVQGGGAGAYHYLVIQAFLLFGITASVAGALALAIHGLQTVIYVVLGSLSLLGYLLFTTDTTIAEPETTVQGN